MKFPSKNAMQEAARLIQTGRLTEAAAAVQRVLNTSRPTPVQQPADFVQSISSRLNTPRFPFAFDRSKPQDADTDPKGGRFLARTFSNHTGSRPYRLYIPAGYQGQPVPLIIMLHGCTQTPEDFATGTRMNIAAEAKTCLVAYPGQTSEANRQKCWNWFNHGEQKRNGQEPSLIAGITREIMADFAVDPARIYVAGLSAGGAAAVIMGDAYPDLFAAIGVHSGLACGAARDMQTAFAAMQRGADGSARSSRQPILPVIVFHGSRDSTVHPRNGDAVIAQAVGALPLQTSIETGRVPGGHAYTKTLHSNRQGTTVMEQWVVEGAGHAWFGGSPAGSFTDPRGPDATAEMLRFFLAHPRAVS